jgi:hypothetical protein
VLAFANRDSLQRFAREQGIGTDELEMLARSGLARAIADAERAGALDPARADQFRGLVLRIPIAELLDLIELLPGI